MYQTLLTCIRFSQPHLSLIPLRLVPMATNSVPCWSFFLFSQGCTHLVFLHAWSRNVGEVTSLKANEVGKQGESQQISVSSFFSCTNVFMCISDGSWAVKIDPAPSCRLHWLDRRCILLLALPSLLRPSVLAPASSQALLSGKPRLKLEYLWVAHFYGWCLFFSLYLLSVF